MANRPPYMTPPLPNKRSRKARALDPNDPNDNAFHLVSLFCVTQIFLKNISPRASLTRFLFLVVAQKIVEDGVALDKALHCCGATMSFKAMLQRMQ